MTRAQFSVLIARTMNLEAENEKAFTDVKGKWYEMSVQALADIVNGKDAATFESGQTPTCQQTSMMIVGLLEHAGVELPPVNVIVY